MIKVSVEWMVYEFAGKPVSIKNWGKDHWSTFAYLETCAVDHEGLIDNRKMRCNPRLHRELANTGGFGGSIIDGSKYPTELKGGKNKKHHDDWSCLEDMVAHGLIRAFFRSKDIEQVFGNTEARIEFTPKGLEIANRLRNFKSSGGRFSTFSPTKDNQRPQAML